MKQAVEMGSGAMMYIQNFIKSGSDIQKLVEEERHRQHCDQDRNKLIMEIIK
jgi:hypothetical protein